MEEVRIDWASAEVDDGKLSLCLHGAPGKAWRAHFERTVALLASHDFTDVKVKKDGIRVKGLTEGDEEKLRHFLEGVVDQANAAAAADEESAASHERAGSQDTEEGRMTASFRSFAEKSER